jgi:hypothetical protein
VLGYADLRRALLELHGLAAGVRGNVDELAGEVHVAVVVDAYLGDDVHRAAAADQSVADSDWHRNSC